MKIGFAAPTCGSWATPGTITDICARADELGYASLWTFQRLLFPKGTGLGETYHSVLDPMVSLGFIAASTRRARLGVAVVNLPFVAPIVLAKQAAAVDVLSDGRLTLGLGLGWAPEEFVATGARTERRGARAVEYVRCLEEIFSGEVDFAGGFYEVPHSDVLPRPVQQPRPPILMGGWVPASLKRAGRIADGWISYSVADLTRIDEAIAFVHEGAEGAGKDPATVEIVVRGLVQMTAEKGADRRPLTGSADQIRDDIEMLEREGVTEVFLDLNFDPEVGSPLADPRASIERAHHVLDAFAPGLDR
jgi:probable F420-dependent oxidoreductase